MSEEQATRKYSEIMDMYREPVLRANTLYNTLDRIHGELSYHISAIKNRQFNANREYHDLSRFYLAHGEDIPESEHQALDEQLRRMNRDLNELEDYRSKKVKEMLESLLQIM